MGADAPGCGTMDASPLLARLLWGMHFPACGSDGVWVLIEESCCSKSVTAHLLGCAAAGALLHLLPI